MKKWKISPGYLNLKKSQMEVTEMQNEIIKITNLIKGLDREQQLTGEVKYRSKIFILKHRRIKKD